MNIMMFPVDLSALRAAWPLVRDRVAQLSIDAKEPWIAEDVYAEILAGKSYLWMNEGARAFVVLSIMEAPYARDLHVWIACNDVSEVRAGEYVQQLREIARQAGCSRVVWESPRGGWQREVKDAEVRHIYIVKA